jgi:beta-phosphoglucomutase-like phosphatase (HAD superfamily)
MTRHRAAIFDMDGVLIDSQPLWREAEIEVFRGVGVSLTEADCALMMGRRIDAVVDHCNARRPSQRRPRRTLHGPPDNRRETHLLD